MEINITTGTSVNLYTALGVTVGSTKIKVQNKSDSPVYLTSNATEPTIKNEGLKIVANKEAINATSDAGAFASAYLADVNIFVEVA